MKITDDTIQLIWHFYDDRCRCGGRMKVGTAYMKSLSLYIQKRGFWGKCGSCGWEEINYYDRMFK